MVTKRDLVTCILLSVVTCGIYAIIWYIQLGDDIRNVSKDETLPTGGMLILLTIITCGIYGIYWSYKVGVVMNQVKAEVGLPVDDSRPILYLILSILQVSYVNFCFIQDDLNKYVESQV